MGLFYSRDLNRERRPTFPVGKKSPLEWGNKVRVGRIYLVHPSLEATAAPAKQLFRGDLS